MSNGGPATPATPAEFLAAAAACERPVRGFRTRPVGVPVSAGAIAGRAARPMRRTCCRSLWSVPGGAAGGHRPGRQPGGVRPLGDPATGNVPNGIRPKEGSDREHQRIVTGYRRGLRWTPHSRPDLGPSAPADPNPWDTPSLREFGRAATMRRWGPLRGKL